MKIMLTRKIVDYSLYFDEIDYEHDARYEGVYDKINPKQGIDPRYTSEKYPMFGIDPPRIVRSIPHMGSIF